MSVPPTSALIARVWACGATASDRASAMPHNSIAPVTKHLSTTEDTEDTEEQSFSVPGLNLRVLGVLCGGEIVSVIACPPEPRKHSSGPARAAPAGSRS